MTTQPQARHKMRKIRGGEIRCCRCGAPATTARHEIEAGNTRKGLNNRRSKARPEDLCPGKKGDRC